MIRALYNERPGCEQAILNMSNRKTPHYHTCPKCGVQWACDKHFCRRMEQGYMDAGEPRQPVKFLCDACLGIRPVVRIANLAELRKRAPRPRAKQRRAPRPRKMAGVVRVAA
jgi:predicted RNA-binding Zn-ribbon protein involved in translation (DUF1610 family)